MDITDPVRAAALVADLGFLLRWDMPATGRRALLVIAIREEPTLRHYDPELLTYWRTNESGRGRLADLTLSTPMPLRTIFSWGRIEISDRLGVTNSFISVGGELRAARVNPDTVVVTLASPGPILAQGGHSQPYDKLAAEMAGFFAGCSSRSTSSPARWRASRAPCRRIATPPSCGTTQRDSGPTRWCARRTAPTLTSCVRRPAA